MVDLFWDIFVEIAQLKISPSPVRHIQKQAIFINFNKIIILNHAAVDRWHIATEKADFSWVLEIT